MQVIMKLISYGNQLPQGGWGLLQTKFQQHIHALKFTSMDVHLMI